MHADPPEPAPSDLRALTLSNHLLEIGLEAHTSPDLAAVVSRLVACILRETTYPYAGIALLDDDGVHVRRFMGMHRTGEVTYEGMALPLGEGVVGHVVQIQRQAVTGGRIGCQAQVLGDPGAPSGHPSGEELGVA